MTRDEIDAGLKSVNEGMLKVALDEIAKVDAENPPAYGVRYRLVIQALFFATAAGLKAGIRIDPADPFWPVVYIELPTGQVSWHMPQHTEAWDGHTTEQKYERIKAYDPL